MVSVLVTHLAMPPLVDTSMHHTFSPFRHLLAILERIVPIDRLPVDREVVSHKMQDILVGTDPLLTYLQGFRTVLHVEQHS